MDIPDLKISCIKYGCSSTEELSVGGFRKDGTTLSPINTRRPSGWTAGLNIEDVTTGFCPSCSAALQENTRKFIEADIPPPAPIPRKHDIAPAKCSPIGNVLIEHVESSTHAPIEPPKTSGMSAFPMRGQPLAAPRIEPTISVATRGIGSSYPAPLPSKPIMTSFHSSGVHSSAPVQLAPAKITMGVTTKTAPLPNHVNCNPDQNGQTHGVFHDYRATSSTNFMPASGFSGGQEVTIAPFEPVSPSLLKP